MQNYLNLYRILIARNSINLYRIAIATRSQALLYFIYSFHVFRAFVPLAVFVLVNHHVPMVLGESTCRKWSESTKCKAWSGSKLGRAGDGALELLPWTACPGTQKNFVPKDPLARDSKGRRFALSYISRLIRFVLCPRTTYHSPIVPAAPSLPARTRALAMKCFLG